MVFFTVIDPSNEQEVDCLKKDICLEDAEPLVKNLKNQKFTFRTLPKGDIVLVRKTTNLPYPTHLHISLRTLTDFGLVNSGTEVSYYGHIAYVMNPSGNPYLLDGNSCSNFASFYQWMSTFEEPLNYSKLRLGEKPWKTIHSEIKQRVKNELACGKLAVIVVDDIFEAEIKDPNATMLENFFTDLRLKAWKRIGFTPDTINVLFVYYGDCGHKTPYQWARVWIDSKEDSSLLSCDRKSYLNFGLHESTITNILNLYGDVILSQPASYWVKKWIQSLEEPAPVDALPDTYDPVKDVNAQKFTQVIRGRKFKQRVFPLKQEDLTPQNKLHLEFNNKLQDHSRFLYHATSLASAMDILKNGIDLGAGSPKQDFSHRGGFYLTDKFDQAVKWADCVANKQPGQRALLLFVVHPDSLKSLHDYHLFPGATDEWKALVLQCRGGEQSAVGLYEGWVWDSVANS